MGQILRLRSTTVNVGAAAYAAGDEISNNATAGSVVRPTFDLSDYRYQMDGRPAGQRKLSGRILAAQLDVTAASGNVTTTLSDFELLVFRTGDVPSAVGDNVTHPIAAATRGLAPARFRFDDTGWTGPLGTVAAGTSQIQRVMATLVQPLASNVAEYPHAYGFPFQFGESDTATFTSVLRTLAAWDPFGAGPAVVHTFGITLDIEVL